MMTTNDSKVEKQRESIIQLSRETIHLSKRIIYCLHRNDPSEASKLMKDIEKKRKELQKVSDNLDININKNALQEYVEAVTYYEFIVNNKLPSRSELKIDSNSYLMGLCDLTGELVRRAVNSVIAKKYDEAEKIKNLVQDIYSEFLKFNFRNNELRVKSDQIKWNLKKLEDVVFELKLKEKI